jgi:hypothetical protein
MNNEDTLRREYPAELIKSGQRGKYAPDGHLKIPHLWPGQNPPSTRWPLENPPPLKNGYTEPATEYS